MYQVPSDELPDGPAIVGSNISSNSAVSSVTSLLNQHGSTVTWGNLVLYPIGQSMLYVRPLYVAAVGGTQVPRVQDVVVVFGSGNSEQIVIQPTLQQALQKLFPDAPNNTFDFVGLPQGSGPSAQSNNTVNSGLGSTTTTTAPGSTTTTSPSTTVPANQTVAKLLQEASDLLTKAQSNLVASCTTGTCDLTAYQNAVKQAQQYLDQAVKEQTGSATTTTSSPSS